MEEIQTAYSSEFEFDELDFVNTVHKAIQAHMGSDFNVCFVGERFNTTELQSFFTDFKKLKKENTCIFVQVRDKVDLDFDRDSLHAIGFETVISKIADHRDKTALWAALKKIIDRKEHLDTLGKLDSIIDNLTEEIDKVALERKRGAKVRLSTIYASYLRDSAGKFKGLADEFYQRLVGTTEDSTPFETTTVTIPDKVLAKNLPHLKKDTYKGQSHRVWEKLLSKHGSGDKSKPEVQEPEDSETSESEEID